MADVRESWDENFKKLAAFYGWHRHTRVPRNGDTTKLSKWAYRQKNRVLSDDQRRRLLELDVNFFTTQSDRDEEQWNTNFERLKLYMSQNGNCSMPQDSVLGTWVANQRRLNNVGKVREDRVAKLNEIGFVWRVRKSGSRSCPKTSKRLDLSWEKQFVKLLAYKQVHGHCNVPYHHKDKSLALWVTTQRRVYHQLTYYGKKSSMDEKRKSQLEEIGFSWKDPRYKTTKGPTATNKIQSARKKNSVQQKVEQIQNQTRPEGKIALLQMVKDVQKCERTKANNSLQLENCERNEAEYSFQKMLHQEVQKHERTKANYPPQKNVEVQNRERPDPNNSLQKLVEEVQKCERPEPNNSLLKVVEEVQKCERREPNNSHLKIEEVPKTWERPEPNNSLLKIEEEVQKTCDRTKAKNSLQESDRGVLKRTRPAVKNNDLQETKRQKEGSVSGVVFSF